QRLVYSVAHVVCQQSEDVSDVFQQVWLDLYQHLSDLRNHEALPAWLITVTRRRASAMVQSRRSGEPLDEDMPDVSRRVMQIEQEHELERALDLLPDRCRQLIDLLYLDITEPSYSQISSMMGMPQSSIGPTRAR